MNPIRVLFDRLTERLFGVISSHLGNAVSAYRIVCASEQQSQLEDLARQYEAEGKQQLADEVRAQAAAISGSDPGSDGARVLERLTGPTQLPGLPEVSDSPPAPVAEPRRPRRSRRCKPTEDPQAKQNDGD